MWGSYGDQGGHWTGGDSTTSVPLPDGRVAWLFSDTYLGTVNPDHSRPANTPMVNNTLVVQSASALGPTLHGGTAAAPTALVPAPANELYWVGDGTVAGGSLKVFYNRYQRTGSGILDVKLAGTALVTFALPALTVAGVQLLPLGDKIGWGSAVVEDGTYTYVYGTESTSDTKFAHLARVPSSLAGAWEFWSGSGWSPAESDSARLLSGVGTAFSVDRVGSSYVLVTQDTNLPFSSSVVAHVAAAPQGPFDAPRYLFDAPEPQTPGRYVYDARTHPELAADGKLLISYNVNSFREADLLADVRVYRPRFVEVAWPLVQPDPAALPGKPTGLVIDGNGSPIRLRWTAPSGGATGYRIYRRDVTAGQTHFTRLAGTVTATSYEEPLLTNGHTYEFRVAAVNAAGEGLPGNTAGVTIQVGPPPAPTAPAATANGSGEITVTWTGVTVPARYSLYLRDVTEGQAEFAPVLLDSPFTTSGTARKLAHNHSYEFVVTAVNGGGESARSTPVRATARYDLPAAPTGLRAVPDNAGSVQLDWTHLGNDFWYWVYQRDVTGGETEFKRLAYPVTQGASAKPGGLIGGHVYEFKVSAINAGGEGPASAVVQVTARFDKPGAPTNLQATANGDGSVGLQWTEPSPGLFYWVYQRDVTGGESFTRLEFPVTQGTSAKLGMLIAGHVYEYAVSAVNAAGEGPRSAGVQVTARVDRPAAPTGLTATAGDGEVTLSWTAVGSDSWYWVHHRDVTAGDTQFSRSAYPVTNGPTAKLGLLTNGHTYEFKVSAINAGGEGDASAVVTAKPMPAKPGRVEGLTLTPDDNGGIKLDWTAVGGDVFYWIYRRDVTAGETTATKLTYPATATSFVAGALTHQHVYEFSVEAENLSGAGPRSAVAQATARYAIPAAPTGLSGQSAGDGSIALTWNGPASGLLYWVYYRDVTAGQTEFTRSGAPAGQPSATISPLVHGHVYEFKVTGVSQAGEGPASATIQVTSVGGTPLPPSGLTAAAGDGKVTLTWTASPSPNVMYWVYYRDAFSAEGFRRLELPASGTTATVSPLVNGHHYEFQVAATNASGDSPPTATATARPLPPLPPAPTGLSAIAGDGEVGLGWQMTQGAELYNVYYRDTTAGQTEWTKLPYPTREWWLTVRPLANGHRYEFQVSAVNMTGEGPRSATVASTPVPPAPQAPSGLTAVAGNGKVSLSWNASPTPNVYYWVYYRPQGHSDWYFFSTPTLATNHVASPLYNGFNYEFKVTAANLGGQSGFSNTVSARPFLPLPAAPTGLTATAGDSKVSLSWNASATPNVYYWVYYRPQGHSSWYYYQYPTLATNYQAPALNGFTYEFKVTAANQAGQSGFSTTVSARPVGPPPIAPTIRAGVEPGAIWLTWACSLESQQAALWIEENRGSGWIRRPNPVWHSIGLCEQSSVIDTAWYSPGQYLQFRVVAERAGATSVSNVVGANVRATRAQFYLSLTEPNAASQQRFFAAKNNQGAYGDYGFDWSDNGCSSSPDYPFGWPFITGCIRHDFGYGNNRRVFLSSEEWRYRIDFTLLTDLNMICAGLSSHQSDCYGVAYTYYTVVRSQGRGAWDS